MGTFDQAFDRMVREASKKADDERFRAAWKRHVRESYAKERAKERAEGRE